MTVRELTDRFPEIPEDLHEEPLLARFAEAFGEQLQLAGKPSACSVQYDAGNHFYMKLINPMAIYRLGLSKRERILQLLQDLLDQHQADPAGFAASLVPADAPAGEVKGPGCN